jgi:protein glucosyltransferase
MPPPSASPSPSPEQPTEPPPTCPDYFRHIHSDLDRWRVSGITREAVERAQPKAAFRLTVVSGRAYVETYHRAFQTRDVFTQWGILQLLARYPGRVPDVDIMFNLEDMPEIRAADYPDPSAAPPLFRYCKDSSSLEVLWPDWSFWGWSEVNIRPWAPLIEEVNMENARLPWQEREPYAFWKGNRWVSEARRDLFRCNNDSAAGKDWNARLFAQDWGAANRNGFKDSNLAKQCRYRYKIYVQGRSWSVSEKYILACDSPMLAIDTTFKDFFSRGLVAGKHYWPIDPAHKCRAVKFAVDWGNAHPWQARRIGEEGSGFAREEMSMDYVYDYMLHVLRQYAALLRYRPTVPEKAVELCPESLACPAQGRDREFMMQSRERYMATYEPCTLPPPFTAKEVREMAAREADVRRKVAKMEGR